MASSAPKRWIGYRRLAELSGIDPVQPFPITSCLGPSRRTDREDGYVIETYPATLDPGEDLRENLQFALKHEGVHLEFLARFYTTQNPRFLEQWIQDTPTSFYARQAGFLYEWLTGRMLTFGGVQTGNYQWALDPQQYVTATASANNRRWRLRDNLPGTPAYCPIVRRTEQVNAGGQYRCEQALQELDVEFGEDLLLRSAVWLTIKESKQSFVIEREGDQGDRIRRFAAVMERRCGQGAVPLDGESLATLQAEILGARTLGPAGLRRSPVFVGEERWAPVVHYIAPHWDQVPGLLNGLQAFVDRTAPVSAASGGDDPQNAPLALHFVRAAVVSFGFVYIHPLADGNGRVSRFLINDMLRRDGAVPAPFILPVSATITQSHSRRHEYDEVLEVLSRPLMQRSQGNYAFGKTVVAEDGRETNFEFSGYDMLLPAWQYPDLTRHVEYVFDIVKQTLEEQMREEAQLLRTWHRIREQIKEVVEGPDMEIDRIIRSVRDTGGQISGKLKKQFPVLEDPAIGGQISAIVLGALNPAEDREEPSR